MGFLEIITLGGTMGTVLGVFLTFYAIINNRALKNESRLTRESLKEARESVMDIIKEESRLTRESIENQNKLTGEVIKGESKLTREFLAEILDRIDRRAEERHREILSKT